MAITRVSSSGDTTRVRSGRTNGEGTPPKHPAIAEMEKDTTDPDGALADFRAYIKGGVFGREGTFHVSLVVAYEEVDKVLPLMKMPGVTFQFHVERQQRRRHPKDKARDRAWETEDDTDEMLP